MLQPQNEDAIIELYSMCKDLGLSPANEVLGDNITLQQRLNINRWCKYIYQCWEKEQIEKAKAED